jgi:hypothetical protein
MVKEMSERKEGWMRIVVGIVSGIILGIWKMLVQVLGVIHFFVVIIVGKRNEGIAEFSEIWNTQMYMYLQYMTFVTNKRPFPFDVLRKDITNFK